MKRILTVVIVCSLTFVFADSVVAQETKDAKTAPAKGTPLAEREFIVGGPHAGYPCLCQQQRQRFRRPALRQPCPCEAQASPYLSVPAPIPCPPPKSRLFGRKHLQPVVQGFVPPVEPGFEAPVVPYGYLPYGACQPYGRPVGVGPLHRIFGGLYQIATPFAGCRGAYGYDAPYGSYAY